MSKRSIGPRPWRGLNPWIRGLNSEPEYSTIPKEGARRVSAYWTPGSSTRRKQQVITMGSFLLQGVETTICEPDLLCREVCFSLGAWIGTLWIDCQGFASSESYLPLIFLVGTNDTVREHLEHNKHDYRDFIFATVAPFWGSMIGSDKIHTRQGKHLINRLANLVRRALEWQRVELTFNKVRKWRIELVGKGLRMMLTRETLKATKELKGSHPKYVHASKQKPTGCD